MRTLILVLCLWPLVSIATQEPDKVELFVVSNTFSIARLDRAATGNLYPWAVPRNDLETIVSTSCGFADYTYVGFDLDAYLNRTKHEDTDPTARRISARGSLGEWCKLSTHLLENDTLVVLGYWEDLIYVIGYADIHFDSDNAEYILDRNFIEEYGYIDLLRSVRGPDKSTGCVDRNDVGEEYFDWLLAQPSVKRFDESACFTSGVYIGDILGAP